MFMKFLQHSCVLISSFSQQARKNLVCIIFPYFQNFQLGKTTFTIFILPLCSFTNSGFAPNCKQKSWDVSLQIFLLTPSVIKYSKWKYLFVHNLYYWRQRFRRLNWYRRFIWLWWKEFPLRIWSNKSNFWWVRAEIFFYNWQCFGRRAERRLRQISWWFVWMKRWTHCRRNLMQCH